MAGNREINININITGSTSGGGSGTSGKPNVTNQTYNRLLIEDEKKKTAVLINEEQQRTAVVKANESIRTSTASSEHKKQVATNSESEKRKTSDTKTENAKRLADHKAMLAKMSLDEKREYAKQQAELRKHAATQNNTWSNALNSYQFKFNALGNIMSNVVSSATNMLKQLGSSVVTISKDFEFSMSGVKAITMATDAEFKALRSDAVRLGGDTIFTASQVAQLQTELAKLGFTVKEIRAATDGVVALAAATGEDLAQSALVAGTIIRGFNLDARDLMGVVDIMSASFNSSALDLYKFSETMKYVAPVASKTGFAMTEVTAIMARLADQGVVASQAGTSLRNLMLRLADSNSKLSKSIGFTVTSLPQLVVGFRKLGEAGLDATKALSLADRYSVTALLGLSQQSENIWKLYRSMISVRDIAQKTADIRMDNFAGSVEKIKGAWDSFVLTINKGNGVLREFVDLGTSSLEFLIDKFGSYQGKIELSSGALMNGFNKYINDSMLRSENVYADQQERLMKLLDDGIITEKQWLEQSSELTKMFSEDKVNIQKIGLQKTIEAEKSFLEKVGKARNSSQMKFIDSHKKYLDELLKLQEDQNNKATQNLVDTLAEQVEEQDKAARTIEQLRIDAMVDGIEKELAAVKLKYDKLEKEAADAGATDIDFTKARQEEINKIYQKYGDELNDLKLDIMEDGFDKQIFETKIKYNKLERLAQEHGMSIVDLERQKNKKIDEINQERANLLANTTPSMRTFRTPSKIELSKTYKQTEKELTEYQQEQAKNLKENMENNPILGAKEPKKGGSVFDFIFGDSEMSREQRAKIMQGVNFISDQLQKVADKEKEIADRRVQNSERIVDQLNQELTNEIALAEAGFASNVSLKQRELDEAKKQQQQALAQQEQALKKQRALEQASQTIDLLSATASILKNSFKKGDPVSASVIAGITLAAMWGTWAWSLTQAGNQTKYAEGGEIGGKKHSEGGTIIEAEKGEFVVKANSYAKHADLVQAINNDNLNQIYGELNKDLSVSLDDTSTAKMLNRHFGKKNVTYGNGYRIEQSGNKIRKIRYAKV